MLHGRHSPFHRRGSMLCDDFSGRSQTVNRSLEYHPQNLNPNSVGVPSPFLNPTAMTLVPPLVMDFQTSYYMDPVNSGMCQPPMYTLHPQVVDPRFVADSGLPANIDDSFIPTSQLPNTLDDFGGMFYGSQVAPQPPTPPAAPGASILQNAGFQYHHCLWLGGPQCDGFAPGKNREMAEHLRVYHHFVGHERDLVCCEWQNCGQFMQRMNVARHIVSRHLLAAATCRFCGRRFCRPDVVTRHERTCNVVPSV